jgi:hypothetical protein
MLQRTIIIIIKYPNIIVKISDIDTCEQQDLELTVACLM